MAPFLFLLRNETVLFLRGRLALFWTLAFPLLLLVIQMTLFGGSNSLGSVRIAIVDPSPTAVSQAFDQFFADALSHQSVMHATVEIVADRPEMRRYDAVVSVPEAVADLSSRGQTVPVRYLLRDPGSPAAGALLGMMRGLTDAYNFEVTGAKPAFTLTRDGDQPLASGNPYSLFLVTGLAVMVILSTSLMGFAVPLVAARKGGLFRLYQLFPVSPLAVLGAWWLSRLIIAVATSLLLFAVAVILYGMPLIYSPVVIITSLTILVLGTSAFLAFGILVSSFAQNLASATMLANLLYFPLLFTGNLLLPTGNLPPTVQNIIQYLPVNALAASLRHTLSGHIDPVFDGVSVGLMLVITVTCFAVASRRFRWVPQR